MNEHKSTIDKIVEITKEVIIYIYLLGNDITSISIKYLRYALICLESNLLVIK